MRVEIRKRAVGAGVADDELVVEVDAALAPRVGELLRREKEFLPLDLHAGRKRGRQRVLLRHQDASLRGAREKKCHPDRSEGSPAHMRGGSLDVYAARDDTAKRFGIQQKMYPRPTLNWLSL